MAKYSFDFKLMVVSEYISGQGGIAHLSKRHGVHHSVIERWILYYKKYGEKGLKRSRKQRSYSFEFKLHVVELYLTGELSYQELALQAGMTNPSPVVRWVMDYRAAGPEALKPKKKGRRRSMDKEEVAREIETGDSDEQKELLKQLQEENLRLRIENAFLKESRRLRLEGEGLLNELRESSTASEENSN